MEAASCSLQVYQVSLSPIRSSPRFVTSFSRISFSSSYKFNLNSSFRVIRLKNRCSISSSADIFVASKENGKRIEEEDAEEREFDLKSWMHSNGLPPCKVVLKEKPSHNSNHRPIHYVAASEELQAGDTAFSVPNSLVVTLEKRLPLCRKLEGLLAPETARRGRPAARTTEAASCLKQQGLHLLVLAATASCWFWQRLPLYRKLEGLPVPETAGAPAGQVVAAVASSPEIGGPAPCRKRQGLRQARISTQGPPCCPNDRDCLVPETAGAAFVGSDSGCPLSVLATAAPCRFWQRPPPVSSGSGCPVWLRLPLCRKLEGLPRAGNGRGCCLAGLPPCVRVRHVPFMILKQIKLSLTCCSFFNLCAAELLASNKLSELACLALYLMYEKKQGKKSFWYPYIRELDRQRGRGQLAVESPLLWSKSELSYLSGSPVLAEIMVRDEGIKKEYDELDTVWFMAGSLFQLRLACIMAVIKTSLEVRWTFEMMRSLLQLQQLWTEQQLPWQPLIDPLPLDF
uniref:Uncharacterized protein n=1 Tax=Chenopodium quinoa TaxID=63459 RepID=A0A803N6C5_CHEQI